MEGSISGMIPTATISTEAADLPTAPLVSDATNSELVANVVTASADGISVEKYFDSQYTDCDNSLLNLYSKIYDIELSSKALAFKEHDPLLSPTTEEDVLKLIGRHLKCQKYLELNPVLLGRVKVLMKKTDQLANFFDEKISQLRRAITTEQNLIKQAHLVKKVPRYEFYKRELQTLHQNAVILEPRLKTILKLAEKRISAIIPIIRSAIANRLNFGEEVRIWTDGREYLYFTYRKHKGHTKC